MEGWQSKWKLSLPPNPLIVDDAQDGVHLALSMQAEKFSSKVLQVKFQLSSNRYAYTIYLRDFQTASSPLFPLADLTISVHLVVLLLQQPRAQIQPPQRQRRSTPSPSGEPKSANLPWCELYLRATQLVGTSDLYPYWIPTPGASC